MLCKQPLTRKGTFAMPQLEKRKRYTFDRPGKYRIRVEGFIDESWSERLGGMRITTSSGEDQKTVTTIEGQIVDQSALAGVLNTLYELHLSLLSVEHINGD
jgi:hypothetical protein